MDRFIGKLKGSRFPGGKDSREKQTKKTTVELPRIFLIQYYKLLF